MATSQIGEVMQHLRRAALLPDGAGLTDGQLLEGYLNRREEAALAALVRRHGPMVWGVCRRVLRNHHDAEDAFQATFLVFVRKAASVVPREMVANWLYGVAHQTALKARATTAKRRTRERQVTEMPEPAVTEQDLWQDLQPLLDQELSRLPNKYRVAIVLCDLEGKTRKEAAQQLRVPEGTLAARVARGRVMLAKRLARYGLTVSGGSLAAMLAQNTASASPPTSVVASTFTAVTFVAAGGAASSVVSAKVAALAEGVIKAMVLTKLKIIVVLILAALGVGTSFFALHSPESSGNLFAQDGVQSATSDKGQPAQAKAAPEPSFDYTAPISVTGRVLDDQSKPIPGATVYLASVGAVHKRLAEAKSDDKGNYEFRHVKLPIQKARPGQFRDLGAFELFGQASGFGFGWRPQKWFYPNPAPAGLSLPGAPDPKAEPHSYEAGDPISLDLTLRAPAHVVGRIIDDRGRPIRQAPLRIVHCEPLAAGAESMFSALAARESAPPAMNVRATDDQGRFDFSGLPPDCRFQILVQPKDHPHRWIWVATTSTPQPAHGPMPVLIGDLKLTFAAPVEVPIRAIFGDSQKPAAKVLVTLDSRDANAAKETDAHGRVTLRVPAGEYHFSIMPAHGTPYLENLDKLVVGKRAPAEPIVKQLRPAGIIEVSVLDKDTQAGIEGVDFWRERGDGIREAYAYRWWDKQIANFVRPRSDRNGKLRVLLEPGKHRIGVGLEARADGFVVVESDGQEIECRPGKPVEARFTMRQR